MMLCSVLLKPRILLAICVSSLSYIYTLNLGFAITAFVRVREQGGVEGACREEPELATS